MDKMTNIPAQPIKSIEDMIRWRSHIKCKYPLKQYVFFILGLDTGIAPRKLLDLTWDNVQTRLVPHKKQKIQELQIQVPSSVFKGKIVVEIQPENITELTQLRNENPDDVYLFQSESRSIRLPQPWSQQYVTAFLKKSALEAGLTEKIGFLTLHKTYGYQLVVRGNFSLWEIQNIFEQHSLAATRKYLDITDENIRLR